MAGSGFTNDVMTADNVDFSGGFPVTGKVTTDGQLLIGATASPNIRVGTLGSSDSSITWTVGAGTITGQVAGGTTTGKTITGDSGGARSPTAGNWNILGASPVAGTTPVATAGAASTLTINVQKSQAIAATDATKVGLSNFNSSHFSVDANGFVSLAGGGIAIDSIGTQTGTNPISPTAAGLVTINGAVVAAGTNPIRSNGTGANTLALEVQTSQALAAADATKIGLSNFDSSSFAVAATGFVTLTTTGAGKTITGDSGGALSPTANNWNILGGPGVTTTGSGSTLTINSVVYTDQGISTSVLSDSGSFATAAITLTLPATPAQGEIVEVISTTAAAIVVHAPSTHLIRIGNSISTAGGNATSNGLTGAALVLRYRSADTTWYATSVISTWTTS